MLTERELRLGQCQTQSCPELREREASQIWPKFQIQEHLSEIRTLLFCCGPKLLDHWLVRKALTAPLPVILVGEAWLQSFRAPRIGS